MVGKLTKSEELSDWRASFPKLPLDTKFDTIFLFLPRPYHEGRHHACNILDYIAIEPCHEAVYTDFALAVYTV